MDIEDGKGAKSTSCTYLIQADRELQVRTLRKQDAETHIIVLSCIALSVAHLNTENSITEMISLLHFNSV